MLEPSGVIDFFNNYISDVAKSKGYNSSESIASYLNSGVLKWQRESEAFVFWRDAVWVSVFHALKSGNIECDTCAEILKSIPEINWPSDD